MSWIDPKSKLSEFIKTAEKIVEEDMKREFAQAEEIRIAAELKARQEVEAKAKLEAEAKTKAEAEAKAKLEAEAKAKAEAEAKAKAEATNEKTITCTKGKLTKKVSGVNPKCPAGYKKK